MTERKTLLLEEAKSEGAGNQKGRESSALCMVRTLDCKDGVTINIGYP